MHVVFLTLNIINDADVPDLFQVVRRLVMQISIAKGTLLNFTGTLMECARLLLLLIAPMVVTCLIVELLVS